MSIARTLAAALLLIAATPARAARETARGALETGASAYIFAGMQDGRIYRSADDGDSWQRADDGLPTIPSHIDSGSPDGGSGGVTLTIGALAVAPDNATVYASVLGNGVWVSRDDGATWHALAGTRAAALPGATSGTPIGSATPGGTSGLPAGSTIIALHVDPAAGQRVLAVSSVGMVYASGDGGATWTSSGGFASPLGAVAFASPPSSSILEGSAYDGIGLSVSGGGLWNSVAGVAPNAAVDSLAFDPRHPERAYAVTDSGVFRSADGGRSWSLAGVPASYLYHGAALPPDSPETVDVDPSGLAGVLLGSAFGGLARSPDGLSWRSQEVSALRRQGFSGFAFDPLRPAVILARRYADGGLMRSDNSGGSWTRLGAPGGDASGVRSLASTTRVPRPTDTVDPPPAGSGARYFSATRQSLAGPFLAYWQAHGGVAAFGFPISRPFAEDGVTVQYFERVRLELRDGALRVSALGLAATAGRSFPIAAPMPATARRLYFPATRQALDAPFLAYWQAHGGATIIGAPISEPLREGNGDGTGHRYLVQYFQNMRLEYHPELPDAPVLPGLLGRQVLHERGWI